MAGMNYDGNGSKRRLGPETARIETGQSDIGMCRNRIWVEVGGRVEDYFRKGGAHPLANEHVQQVLKMTLGRLELLDDGVHFRRNMGNPGESEAKALFGFKDRQTAENFLSQMDCEIKQHEFNSEALHGSEVRPKDLGYAVSFVDQLTDLYDEEGFRDLTPGLSAELDASIETLEKHLTQRTWVKHALSSARFLRESMPGIEPIDCYLELHTKAARDE